MSAPADFPLTFSLTEKSEMTFERWLAGCRERGYRVWLAWDESHAIAEEQK